MKKNILIIGGAGFIGSNLIRFITYNSNNYNIISIDKLEDQRSMHNVYANKNNNFFIADANDKNILNNIFAFNRPQIIINLTSDLNSFMNVCEIAYSYKAERVIHVSYPNYKNYGIPLEQGLEHYPINTINVNDLKEFYSTCIDNYMTSKIFGYDYNIIRSPKCFGPRQQIDNTIPNLIYHLIKDNRVVLPNKGMDIFDLLYVEDLSNAIFLILEKGEPYNIYNASINLDYTEFELAAMIRDLLLDARKNKKLDYDVGEIVLDDFVENISILPTNSDKIRSLGWKPLRKFKENLKYTVNWYLNNKWFMDLNGYCK